MATSSSNARYTPVPPYELTAFDDKNGRPIHRDGLGVAVVKTKDGWVLHNGPDGIRRDAESKQSIEEAKLRGFGLCYPEYNSSTFTWYVWPPIVPRTKPNTQTMDKEAPSGDTAKDGAKASRFT